MHLTDPDAFVATAATLKKRKRELGAGGAIWNQENLPTEQ
jgi:hypothetical protein